MNAEQQGKLLDLISKGMCPYGVCGLGGRHLRRLTYLVNSLTLPVALVCGTTRVVTLDLLVCDIHARA